MEEQKKEIPVNNTLAWFIAFIPLIGALFYLGGIAMFIINSLLCELDCSQLRKSGYDTSKLGSA